MIDKNLFSTMYKRSVNARVILTKNRFFCGYGKNKSIKTAWCLAGALLFNDDRKLKEVTDYLDKKNRKYDVLDVSFISGC